MKRLYTKGGVVWWACIGVFVVLAVGGITVGVVGSFAHSLLLSGIGIGACVMAVIFGLTTHNFWL